MRNRFSGHGADRQPIPSGSSSDRDGRLRRARHLGAALSLGGAGILTGTLLGLGTGAGGVVPVSAQSTAVIPFAGTPTAKPTHTPKPTRTPKSTPTAISTPTSTVTASTTVVPGGTSTLPAPTPTPASTGGVQGASTSSSSSGGAVVGPPGTGADVPFVSGSLLLLAGGGLMAAARRRRV
jgi:hypothetical protein